MPGSALRVKGEATLSEVALEEVPVITKDKRRVQFIERQGGVIKPH